MCSNCGCYVAVDDKTCIYCGYGEPLEEGEAQREAVIIEPSAEQKGPVVDETTMKPPPHGKPAEPTVEAPKEAKPPSHIEEICRGFYDKYIFRAVILDTDVWSDYLDIVFKNTSEADPSFATVDRIRFDGEMAAMRMELFLRALALKLKNDESSADARYFTRHYLEAMGTLDIYDSMGAYNLVLDESAVRDPDGKPVDGRKGRAQIQGISQRRSDRARAWIEANVKNPSNMTDNEKERLKCATPVWSYIGVDIKSNERVAIRMLAASLANRLGRQDLQPKALVVLQATIFAFYAGAEESLGRPEKYQGTPAT